jgi:cell division transport system ATP-binding protein
VNVTDNNQAQRQDESQRFLQPNPILIPGGISSDTGATGAQSSSETSPTQILEELLAAQESSAPKVQVEQYVSAGGTGAGATTAPPIVAPSSLPSLTPANTSAQTRAVASVQGAMQSDVQPAVPEVTQPVTQPVSQSTVQSVVQPAMQPAVQPTVQVPAVTSAPIPEEVVGVPPRPMKGIGRSSGRQVSGNVPVILFDGVTKIYPAQPNKPALSNVSLKIHAGEFIFLVGHSGSGKSTFIRLINREILATRGRLTVAGEDVIRMRNWRVPYLRRNIGCVFQDFKLLPNKTAFENVAFALEVIGKSKHIIRTQVPEVLRLVGLEDKLDQLPDQLSGGEQQRVSIARAIVNRPPLLICDEPTGNLDPQTSLGIMRLLDRINRTGTTILVATHDREMVDSLRKRVVALENGYLVRDQDKGVYGLDA